MARRTLNAVYDVTYQPPVVVRGEARYVEDRATHRGGAPDRAAVSIEDFLTRVAAVRPARVPDTAVFMTAQPRGTPPALAHNLRYNKVLHEHVITLMVTTEPIPHVPANQRVTVRSHGQGVFEAIVRYGFMEDPNVPEALERAGEQGALTSIKTTSPTLLAAKPSLSRRPGEWPRGGNGCSC